jgi:hypothetical protein
MQVDTLVPAVLVPRESHVGQGWISFCRRAETILASSYFAVPILVVCTAIFICICYVIDNSSGIGEPMGWLDGASSWPTIAIIFFTFLLSIHFILRGNYNLRRSASELTRHFGLTIARSRGTSYFNWEKPPLIQHRSEICIEIGGLWSRYLERGRLHRRIVRTIPMVVMYFVALVVILPLIGAAPTPPIRGTFPFCQLIVITVLAFVFLTFFVVDATLLHEGLLKQLAKYETFWPNSTFERFEYARERNDGKNERELAYYWDIVLISRRTESVGNLIYYPFLILFLLIVARLPCFDDWTWTPSLIVALCMHFSVAFYAAWRLPRTATMYRDKVLGELRRIRRQALMIARKEPDVIDTMIDEVESTHRGAFSYLWDQPAIRALLLPSGGIGMMTLIKFLPH